MKALTGSPQPSTLAPSSTAQPIAASKQPGSPPPVPVSGPEGSGGAESDETQAEAAVPTLGPEVAEATPLTSSADPTDTKGLTEEALAASLFTGSALPLGGAARSGPLVAAALGGVPVHKEPAVQQIVAAGFDGESSSVNDEGAEAERSQGLQDARPTEGADGGTRGQAGVPHADAVGGVPSPLTEIKGAGDQQPSPAPRSTVESPEPPHMPRMDFGYDTNTDSESSDEEQTAQGPPVGGTLPSVAPHPADGTPPAPGPELSSAQGHIVEPGVGPAPGQGTEVGTGGPMMESGVDTDETPAVVHEEKSPGEQGSVDQPPAPKFALGGAASSGLGVLPSSVAQATESAPGIGQGSETGTAALGVSVEPGLAEKEQRGDMQPEIVVEGQVEATATPVAAEALAEREALAAKLFTDPPVGLGGAARSGLVAKAPVVASSTGGSDSGDGAGGRECPGEVAPASPDPESGQPGVCSTPAPPVAPAEVV